MDDLLFDFYCKSTKNTGIFKKKLYICNQIAIFMRKIIIRTLQIAGGIGLLTTILLTVAAFVLNSPQFQAKMLEKAETMLSEKLQTSVNIDSVSIGVFTGSVQLYGLEIEDQQQRKMLQMEQLDADIVLSELLKNRVVIEAASIRSLHALLLKPSAEEEANYQFVIDAFKKKKDDKPKKKDNNGNKLTFDIDKASLVDIHVRYNDSDISLAQAQYGKKWTGKQRLEIRGIDASWTSHSKRDSIISNFASLGLLTATTETKQPIEKGGRLLIDISQLRYKNDNHKPRKNVGKPKRGFFDAKHLDVTADLKLTIDSIVKGTVVGKLTQMTATDSISGIDIRDLRAGIKADKEKVVLSDVTILQKNTELKFKQAELVLPNKKKGRRFSYSTSTITGRTQLKDISRAFAPVLNKFTMPLNLSVRMSGTDSTIAFRDILVTTDDKKLSIKATGDIKNLKEKEKLNVHFDVSKMTARGDIKEKIINQFTVKKLMMKQLRLLGDINYTGYFAVLWKRVTFQGTVGTAGGALNCMFTLDGLNKYITGSASSQAFNLGKVMDIKGMGDIAAHADFKIDISKPRTALMRKKKGGKLPIGNVSAKVTDCSYKGIHVRNITAVIESDGAVASGDIHQHGNYRDLYCSFSFTDTDQMHKMKITNPGIKFHKISDEDRKAKEERKQQKKLEKQKAKEERKAEKAAAKEAKKAQKAKEEKEGKKKKKFLGLF